MQPSSELQKYIYSQALYQKSDSIGKKYGLDIDAIGNLQLLIIDSLLGTIDLADLRQKIAQEMSLSNDTASLINTEIQKEIIDPIKNLIASTAPQPEKKPAIHDEVFVPPAASKPEVVQSVVPENLPSLPEEHELTLRKIITPNSILNKQLEVPVAQPYEKPRPVEVKRVIPTAPVVPQATTQPMVAQTQIQKPAPSIVEARLRGSLTMPQEEITIPTDIPKQAPPAAPAPKVDPYREPIE